LEDGLSQEIRLHSGQGQFWFEIENGTKATLPISEEQLRAVIDGGMAGVHGDACSVRVEMEGEQIVFELSGACMGRYTMGAKQFGMLAAGLGFQAT
jgi:hypothetical protein